MGILDLADRAWPITSRIVGLHTKIYQLTGGKIGHRMPGMTQMLLLEHTGARTGTHRTTPLVYAEDARNLVIIASKGGHPNHPAWFHNLVANPDTAVQVGAEHHTVHARVAAGRERERLWALAVSVYSGYEGYQRRTDRQIPVVVLEPRSA
ncbi:MAG: nitroreductase family deazaflavin-dependent oxidoreductase [Pseudonocardiales bacterium]|nr:nitroreductase family deazaflavin-dependent oxidoreductase [Pseudonocardiales bacterium]